MKTDIDHEMITKNSDIILNSQIDKIIMTL